MAAVKSVAGQQLRIARELLPLPGAVGSLMLKGMAKRLARFVVLLKPKQRWARFSLRTLLVLVTALCIVLATWIVPAERQRRAVTAIRAAGGWVEYAEDDVASQTFAKALLWRWLPQDYASDVQALRLGGDGVDVDAALRHVPALRRLRRLDLSWARISEHALPHLQALTNLEELSLGSTQTCDATLAHLAGLASLQELNLITHPRDRRRPRAPTRVERAAQARPRRHWGHR